MTLVSRFEQLIRCGLIKGQSQLAHYAQIATGRMTPIMTLLNLAPKIQRAILELPLVEAGRARITKMQVRPIAMEVDGRSWLAAQGLLSLKPLWTELAPLRRTACCGAAC